ncbi:MAG: zinc ribbon domain-containing protein [Chloroflexi bacterium]|nr:zinc ribbon domain-containing protein [Chloroflexota bacterium]
MPIYEYKCDACGEEFERRVSLAEAKNVCCPKCGAGRPRRVLSQFGKSSGFKGPRPDSARPMPTPTL